VIACAAACNAAARAKPAQLAEALVAQAVAA
jgi:hypothetical protein